MWFCAQICTVSLVFIGEHVCVQAGDIDEENEPLIIAYLLCNAMMVVVREN